MARSLHYEKWGYCTAAKPCWMIKRLTPIWVFITALDGESGFSDSYKSLGMTSLSVMHGPSLIQPVLHVCALSPSNAVNFVYYQVAAESSEYTFHIFTPAICGTYGLKATEEEELIFEVSQL